MCLEFCFIVNKCLILITICLLFLSALVLHVHRKYIYQSPRQFGLCVLCIMVFFSILAAPFNLEIWIFNINALCEYLKTLFLAFEKK